jgi:ABC-type dipeptide/oligopeptide/nickel transport system permease component
MSWSWALAAFGIAGLAAIARATGLRWLARRIVVLGVTLIGASIFVFAVLQIAPGDPAQFMMGLEASPRAVASLRTELGLDGSAMSRYFGWVGGLLHGELGLSYTYRIPVVELLASRLALSLPLAGLAMLLSVAIGLPAALAAARRPGGWVDRLIAAIAQIGLAMPGFWLAMLLLLLFAVRLRWFGAGGFPGWEGGIGPALRALVLPTIALALPQAAVIARVARGSLGEELRRDYVRTARAKGLGRNAILWRHALPNAAAPILTIIGLQFPFLLAGGVIVENVFYLPGLGRLVLQAIGGRDLITVQAVAMLMVLATVATSFLIDVAQIVVDPRIGGRR